MEINKIYGCPNSKTGYHQNVEKIGKNKNKLDQCIYCRKLKSDIVKKEKNETSSEWGNPSQD